MSTEPRNQSVIEPAVLPLPLTEVVSDAVLACVVCDQEMRTDKAGALPLHMAEGRLCLGSCTEGVPSKGGTRIVEPLTIEAVAELSVSEICGADICWSCGGPKTPGQTLCKTDHGLLPYVHQKALPPFVRGYLFSDEKKNIESQYSKNKFMEVLLSALRVLAQMRSERVTRQQSIGG